MQYDPKQHHRRSIRLSGYDYSQNGAYFVTLCTYNRECLFGEIVNGAMCLNNAGKMMCDWWLKIPNKFPTVELDEFVIMLNHIHGIIQIVENDNVLVGADPCVRPDIKCVCPDMHGEYENAQGAHTGAPLHSIVQWFKTMTTNEYIRRVKSGEFPSFETSVWQRNYYEHIIRNETALQNIQEYIQTNPKNWQDDENFREI